MASRLQTTPGMNGPSPILLDFHPLLAWAAGICTVWLLVMLRIALTTARIDSRLQEDSGVLRRAGVRASALVAALGFAGATLVFDGWGIAALAATAGLGALHVGVVIRGSRAVAAIALGAISGAALIELGLAGSVAGSAVCTVGVLRVLLFLVDNHVPWRGTGYGNGGSHVRVEM